LIAKELSPIAKKLRKTSTDAERFLWRHLRSWQNTDQVKFRRQHPIGPYVVDFVSLEDMLVIELDGGQHKKTKERDRERDTWLEESGYKVKRFWNSDVFKNTEGVLKEIKKALGSGHSPSPRPSPLKGEGAYKVSVNPKES
jgi:very-short-patch-repair endonuclease